MSVLLHRGLLRRPVAHNWEGLSSRRQTWHFLCSPFALQYMLFFFFQQPVCMTRCLRCHLCLISPPITVQEPGRATLSSAAGCFVDCHENEAFGGCAGVVGMNEWTNEWMNDLVDRSQHSDWITHDSCCFRPITCSLACLYGNLRHGCQGLCPETITHSLYMWWETIRRVVFLW